jgi:5-methylcytosine-specific restriction endonuclease McrA
MDDATQLRIWRRDGFKCVYCGFDGRASYEAFHHLRIDHLRPEAIGGGDEDEN